MNFESKDYSFDGAHEPIVIAEVGVNHNGSLETAKQLVDMAVRSGCQVVKFQSFKSEKEISRFATKTPYQQNTTGDEYANQLELCKALELSESDLGELKSYCASLRQPFLCTAFEFESVDFLVDKLKVQTLKIPSGEITNIPFLKYIASKKVAAILSTGASTLGEVECAVDVLQNSGCPEILLLHCVSSYPAPVEQTNLRAIQTLSSALGLPVGLSDHSAGVGLAIGSVALGACAIEKHITLDRQAKGPDHLASIEEPELRALVAGTKEVWLGLGNGIKRPAHCEHENIQLIRKSIVSSRALSKGTVLDASMLELKRPATGIAPVDFDKVIGLKVRRDIEIDEPISWKDLE